MNCTLHRRVSFGDTSLVICSRLGYNVCQDWFQYMFNNHPLLGICCHHRFHPVTKRHRLIILLGSFSFGVAITNAIYLWFLGSGRDAEKQVFAVQLTTLGTAADATSLSVQSGVLTLLTVGSGSNALFDRFIWGMSACRCCRAGGRFEDRGCCRDVGYHVALLLVVATVALTSCIVVVRASMDEGQIAVPLVQNRTEAAVQDLLDFRGFVDEFDAADYSFLKGYALEFVVSLFVYYPILQTVFFSGILGCGSVPVLGGRPYSMKQEAKRQAKRQAEVQSVCPTEEDIA